MSDSPPFLLVLVPALDDSGPVRGAVALANGLVGHVPVRLVALKPSSGCAARIDSRIEVVSLADEAGWAARIRALRRLLAAPDGARPVSISFCFSADMVNALMRPRARIVASVRGNLPRNYRYEYGAPGLLLAAAHLLLLRRFDTVVAMSASMQAQLRRWGLRRLVRIGNFVDETALDAARTRRPAADGDALRLAYVGSLSRRKRVELLLQSAAALRGDGVAVRLDIVGDGPLRVGLQALARRLGLEATVTFHGQLPEPAALLCQADYLVLASASEGVSRAMLEALHLGVPCIARDVDANAEVIEPGRNGYLFATDEDLTDTLRRAARERARFARDGSLLPAAARLASGIAGFRALAGA